MFHVDDTNQQQQEEEAKSRITVSKQFKDKVVKPILKVRLISWLNLIYHFVCRDIFVAMNFSDE